MSTPETTKKTTVTTTQLNEAVAKFRKANRRQVSAAQELIEVLGPALSGQTKVVQPATRFDRYLATAERSLAKAERLLYRVKAKVAKFIPFFPA